MITDERKILIVDDDHGIRESLQEVLEMEGFHVETASNGQEALAQLQKSLSPCLIFLDLMMPVMSGWDFLEYIRQSPNFKAFSIPIFVISAATDKLQQALSGGISGFIKKPIDLNSVLEAVHQHCLM